MQEVIVQSYVSEYRQMQTMLSQHLFVKQISIAVASSLLCAINGLQSPLEVRSLLMVRSAVEQNWNRDCGTSELVFVFSALRIWLYLTPDIPDVDGGKEPTLRGSKYIAGETYNQSVRF